MGFRFSSILVTFLGLFAQNIYADKIPTPFSYTVEAPSKVTCATYCGMSFSDPYQNNLCPKPKRKYILVQTACDHHLIDSKGNRIQPGQGDGTCTCTYDRKNIRFEGSNF